ncbi:adenylate kinase isoenzyme 5-like [Diadema antillarum]|uniref:adenylate kinase isoenzyme 5-like n=1 Tax=Diadema antillarum TaxID=105358 RepID=UPI003A85CBF7
MGEKESSESYITRRRIRQLFQSLMAGILYHKPDDHVAFLMACLRRLQDDPLAALNVRWNTFIDLETEGPNGSRVSPGGPLCEGGLSPEEINQQLQTFLTGTGFLY